MDHKFLGATQTVKCFMIDVVNELNADLGSEISTIDGYVQREEEMCRSKGIDTITLYHKYRICQEFEVGNKRDNDYLLTS